MVVKKNAQQAEIKGLDKKLSDLQISDGDLLRLELGTPHEEESFEIHAQLVTLVGGDADCFGSVNDEVLFTKTSLCTVKVYPSTTTVLSLKQQILQALKNMNGPQVDSLA